MVMKTITAQKLKPLLTAGPEIAFVDVREHGQYGEGHPFFCVCIPFSILEQQISYLIPRLTTPLVLMDNGDGVSEKAIKALDICGYSDVSVLEGGIKGWENAGFGIFKGVNLPSKTFGEILEHERETPSLSAVELKERLDSGENIIILDGRSPKEYTNMTIPGARSCPNAELAYRWTQLVPDQTTPVIVNCAGRTRSILGTEILRLAGVKNPVQALRNGTQGWNLAGFELSHNNNPGKLPELAQGELALTVDLAGEIIEQNSLDLISPDTLSKWQEQAERTTYLIDVRTQEEYRTSHISGARHAPGGQLIQATDEYVGVRGARIVLSDDTHLRASITAVWLQRLGHDVSILDADASRGTETWVPTPRQFEDSVSLSEAHTLFDQGALLLDASRAMDYRQAHIRGAEWVTRARLDRLDIHTSHRVIVTARDASLISGVVSELNQRGISLIDWVQGTPQSWESAGFELEATPHMPTDENCIDYLFFVHDRHDGNLDAARRYLEWETGLVDQLDDQERGIFNR